MSVSDDSFRTGQSIFVAAFIDELYRAGVRHVVVCPGSRSTPLAVLAHHSKLDVFVDVDERGASFFALGLAKASGRPVAVITTSGTAVANCYPAVLEAETSRVPLIVLTGDRPAHLQNLGAPQTFDQLNAFGSHVAAFWNMPHPNDAEQSVRFARQAARETVIAAAPGTHISAPVHVNFQLDEPLTPVLQDEFFTQKRSLEHETLPSLISGQMNPFMANGMAEGGNTEGTEDSETLPNAPLEQVASYLLDHSPIILCGENTFTPGVSNEERSEEAALLVALAEALDAPLIADPLSDLRMFDAPCIVANGDSIFSSKNVPAFDAVVRFGRYPISKRITTYLAKHPHAQIVVDPKETRDLNAVTTTFVQATPVTFASALLQTATISDRDAYIASGDGLEPGAARITSALAAWQEVEASATRRLNETIALTGAYAKDSSSKQALKMDQATNRDKSFCDASSDANIPSLVAPELTYTRTLIDALPNDALLFAANSMAVRAVDSVLPAGRNIRVMANRGLNGIDGTTSTALGAAQTFKQCAYLCGDLTFLHDLNALALQNEFLIREGLGAQRPSIVITCFNNQGGAIFDMLPQSCDEPWFERLFLAPQNWDLAAAASAFNVPYRKVTSVASYQEALDESLGEAGIYVIEVPVPLRGTRERFSQHLEL